VALAHCIRPYIFPEKPGVRRLVDKIPLKSLIVLSTLSETLSKQIGP
jgi:hypothetical protein